MAGVPDEVTDRAKAILKHIESGDRQFDKALPETDNEDKQQTEVEKILSEVNLDNITPMQAFLILSDLVEKVKV
ncbi:MAG: hypothetical protein K2N22_01750 [Clostridia bacterium]|nr:hypothetical protein [Clostridia bacterium]